jgi:transcriptional regulator with XRE-family HTH domain/Zn-dependent peptidase ImmA (M78 family)
MRSHKELNVKKITEKLDSLGLSQSHLASELHVSREAVSKWMKNEKFPRAEKLLRLAKTLKLSFDEIVTKIESERMPIIAFRKKGSHKISKDYIEDARYMGSLLEKLVPYLPFDNFYRPPSLIDPKLDYEYVRKITKEIRANIGADGKSEIPFESLISFFSQYHAVIIPVFWGNREQHENALHIYLPKTMTTWIYLNLDSKTHDFKFWMSHELGHVISPDLKGDKAEDFADAFAGALLIDEGTAETEYIHLRQLGTIPKQINRIKAIAQDLVVSPITVYYEINKYAQHTKKPKIDLETNQAIFKAATVLSKQFKTVSQLLFYNKKPTPTEYISCPKKLFQSPFFDALKSFLKESKKSAAFIQNILNLPLADAQHLYEELC